MAKAANNPETAPASESASPPRIVVPPNLARRIARAAPAPASPGTPAPALVPEIDPEARHAAPQRDGEERVRLVVAPPEVFDGANPAVRERAWLAFYTRAIIAFAGRFEAVLFTEDRAPTGALADAFGLPAEVLVTQPIAPASDIALRMLGALRELGGDGRDTDQAMRLARELTELADLFADKQPPDSGGETASDPLAADGSLAHLGALTALQTRPLDCDDVVFPFLHPGARPTTTQAAMRVCVYLPLPDHMTGPLDDSALSLLSLASRLARDGHTVTLVHDNLSTRDQPETLRRRLHRAAPGDVEVVEAPTPTAQNTKGLLGSVLTHPYNFLEWLKTRHFDVVHLPDSGHPGYFALLAKRQGLAFADTHFCIHADKPALWHKLVNADPIDGPHWLARFHAERRCVEYADTLVAPTQYMLRWLLRQGYAIPRERSFVHPLLADDTEQPHDRREGIDELVFVGRIEPANGLPQFLDAVLRARNGDGPTGRVTFAGPENPAFPTRAFVESKLARTGIPWSFRDDVDADAIAGYIAGGKRLAVFPCVEANGSRALQACLERGLPILASRCEGLRELIHVDDHPHATVELHPARMAERFRSTLKDGVAAARPAIASQALHETWRDWHAPPSPRTTPASRSSRSV